MPRDRKQIIDLHQMNVRSDLTDKYWEWKEDNNLSNSELFTKLMEFANDHHFEDYSNFNSSDDEL